MTAPQRRLVDIVRAYRADGTCAEFWPVVNDWVRDAGPSASLALRNINRTVDALTRAKVLCVTDDGLFELGGEPCDIIEDGQ